MRPPSRRVVIAGIVQSLQGILQSVQKYSKHSFKRFGVTGPQVWALRSIGGGRGITVGQLADAMYLHISTISSLVDRLEERKLVIRRRDPRDRRVVRLRLTSRGRKTMRATPPPPRGRLPKGLERLNGRDLRNMQRALRQIAGIMEVTESKPRLED
ncbi:MAG: winged helix-turn-helix transcriptional regulator [Planctomycetes bacterium]|nr:winged helix-turn-helix transcriptional regulator [Planctomycetota bacterium]